MSLHIQHQFTKAKTHNLKSTFSQHLLSSYQIRFSASIYNINRKPFEPTKSRGEGEKNRAGLSTIQAQSPRHHQQSTSQNSISIVEYPARNIITNN